MSLTAWLSVYYTFIPSQTEIKTDKDGLLLPPEYCGHMRCALKNHNFHVQIRSGLNNPAEANRDDIWWIEPDGSNIEVMIDDLTESLKITGIPWFQAMTNLDNVFNQIMKDRDCYEKFRLMMYLSKELGAEQEYVKFKKLFEEEARRINQPAE